MQEIPVHRHGVSSFSFQSGKLTWPASTADFRERRERPSAERENTKLTLTVSKNTKRNVNA